MGYVAVKGGQRAIENAEAFFNYLRSKGSTEPISLDQIVEQLYLLVDRVMSEGGLYAPFLAVLAIKQSAGDTLEASFMLRAYRTTLPRICYSLPQSTKEMRVIRRISAAFKDIPGGQILGPTPDYTLRILDYRLLEEKNSVEKIIKSIIEDVDLSEPIPDSFPKLVDLLKKEGLLLEPQNTGGVYDITREPIKFPAPRSVLLQSMARGETGGLLLLAYSNMRGYGDIHPTVGELRVGYIPVRIKHPYTGDEICIGEVKVTEAEVIAKFTDADGVPKFTIGYGLCFGHNETKAISMAILDRAMQTQEPVHPSQDQEFVIYHIDGVESMGFCNHYKLPHYVTFQSDLDRLRKAMQEANAGEEK